MKTYSRLTLAFLLLILFVPSVGADEPPENGKHLEHHGNEEKKSDGNPWDGGKLNEPFVFDWSEDAEIKNRASVETRTHTLQGKLPEGSVHFDVLLPDGAILSRRLRRLNHKDSRARIRHQFAKEQSKRAALDCEWELILSPTQTASADDGKPNELRTKIIVEQHLNIRSPGSQKIPTKESAIVAEYKRLRDEYLASEQEWKKLLKKAKNRAEGSPVVWPRSVRLQNPMKKLQHTFRWLGNAIDGIRTAQAIIAQLTNSVIEYRVYVQPPDDQGQIVLMQSPGFAKETASKADLERLEKRAAEIEAKPR